MQLVFFRHLGVSHRLRKTEARVEFWHFGPKVGGMMGFSILFGGRVKCPTPSTVSSGWLVRTTQGRDLHEHLGTNDAGPTELRLVQTVGSTPECRRETARGGGGSRGGSGLIGSPSQSQLGRVWVQQPTWFTFFF